MTTPDEYDRHDSRTPFSTNGAEERWAAFMGNNVDQVSTGSEYAQVFEYLRGLVGQYADSDFWDGRSVDKAVLMSSLTLLRFWFAQLGQTMTEAEKLEV